MCRGTETETGREKVLSQGSKEVCMLKERESERKEGRKKEGENERKKEGERPRTKCFVCFSPTQASGSVPEALKTTEPLVVSLRPLKLLSLW